MTSSELTVRAGPGSSEPARGPMLGRGETVTVSAASGDWFRIETSSGQSGWVLFGRPKLGGKNLRLA